MMQLWRSSQSGDMFFFYCELQCGSATLSNIFSIDRDLVKKNVIATIIMVMMSDDSSICYMTDNAC